MATSSKPKNIDSLPDFFGTAFLINLPERVDRLKSAQKQFARVHWRLGAEGVRLFAAKRFSDAGGFPNSATRGCFESHLECLRVAQAEGRGSVLIMEDDIGLTSSLPRLTTSIMSQLNARQWDIVHFGHYETGDIPTAKSDTTNTELHFLEWNQDMIGAHFYAVNARVLPRLITHLDKLRSRPSGDPEGGPMSPDGAYNVFRNNNQDVSRLISQPKLGWQSSSRSDLAPNQLDRVVALRPIVDLLRTLKRARSQWRS
jgi:glycosyl transferase, family 25